MDDSKILVLENNGARMGVVVRINSGDDEGVKRVSTIKEQEEEYIMSLNEKENKAYFIAKKYLGTSFDLKKSNGFLQWKKEKELSKSK